MKINPNNSVDVPRAIPDVFPLTHPVEFFSLL